MKGFICTSMILVMLFLIGGSAALAEDGFLPIAEEYIYHVTDFAGKDSAVLSASGYSPNKCIISFDFTDGNQSIVAIDGNQCEVFYFFDDNELMSALLQMITKFGEVEARISLGKQLEYEMRFSETEIHHITSETMRKHYSWIQ